MKKASDCRTFVVAGHSGSGKTILCERILFKTGTIDRMGAIDSKNTVSDFTPEEQAKGASIYSSVMHCEHDNLDIFMVDTPGYGEFVGELVGALGAVDAALVVIDAVDGPQVGTARAWKMSKAEKLPRYGFVSRLDHERADFEATLELMRANHGRTVIIPLTYPDGSGSQFTRVYNVLTDTDIPASIAKQVAECRSLWMDVIAEDNEELMMRYLDGEELTREEIADGLRKAALEGRAIPVFAGSAAKDIGIEELLHGIEDIFPNALTQGEFTMSDGSTRAVSDDGEVVVRVFKSVNDPFTGQLSFLRVRSGTLHGDSDMVNRSRDKRERVGALLLMNGKNQTSVKSAEPGSLVAVAKLKDTGIGDTLSLTAGPVRGPIAFPAPVMSVAIAPAKPGDDDKLANGLHKIAETDPTVRLERHPETHELLLCGMGDQHIGIVLKRLKEQYKVEAVTAAPKIPYRETITAAGDGHYRHKKQTGGAGQFAEVQLKIEYNESGNAFENAVVGGNIPRNFIPAIEKGVQEVMTRGPLVGCMVERIKVTVLDGKYHPVDSNEMAFKIAGRMALKEAIAKAKPILLEPIMRVQIMIPETYTGDISADMNHKRGRIMGMGMDEGMSVVHAEVPLAELARYATELRSMTQGRGMFEMEFERYEQVPANITDEIIAKHKPQDSGE